MVPAMSYRVYVGAKDNMGNKVYLKKEDGTTTFESDELYCFLRENLPVLPKKVRENHWHLTVEEEGKPVSDEDFGYYLSMYNITEEELEEERVKRLKRLHLEETALKDAIKNKTMWISENMGLPWNVNYFLPGYTYEKEVRRAMKKVSICGAIPYFAIVDHLRDGGIWVSVLYISLHKSEWPYERADNNGYIDSGVYNSAFDGVDFGTIQIRCGLGGSVKRVA